MGLDVEDDGLDFPQQTIQGEPIREAALYDGVRIKLEAHLGKTRIPLQVGVGFGDVAGSQADNLVYPTLLDHNPPRILAYRPPFVVAEKLEALVSLGLINSRLKDFYDLWRILKSMDLPHGELVDAVRATFSRRGTAIPVDVPPTLRNTFARDTEKRGMWDAFVGRNGLDVGGESFESIVRDLRLFLMRILADARRNDIAG